MLIVGDTGTGKTRAIKKLISQLLGKITSEGKYGWENGEMVLSATSTPQQIQRYTESKLEKHKKGVYGPKNPNNHLLIFIDDLNMPVKEKFGAQPSIEMMRQIMDSNGFYNEKTLEFSLIVRQLSSVRWVPQVEVDPYQACACLDTSISLTSRTCQRRR